MIWCPRCEQGWVVACRIRGRQEQFLVCEECDTVWESGEPENTPPFVILEQYLARFGLSALWCNLERI
ncbi:hypothetical protein GCM10022285_57000 [Streptomyces tunisiensis]|uniref:Uncharacterized protein n=1 Tax=Streptomyces tunisiensis TaxID=948699 RepID=A0ABP7Z6Z7_9ACTN